MGETSFSGLSDGCAFFKRFQIIEMLNIVVERVLDWFPVIKTAALPRI